ncbi:NUDIX domain-containing protein [Streptomyces sp. NPDC020379]|uniref:NUDIX domain-containing protein n=1 Tax=Streptomyces sp. NPDC020379 TaxID=3365071 RepID=UPI00379FBC88
MNGNRAVENHLRTSDWARLSGEVVHRGDFLIVHRDQAVQPDGAPGTYEHVTINEGARIVAVDASGNIPLVEDDLYLQGRRQLAPAGGGLRPGEDPETRARREFKRPGELRLLARFHPLPATTSASTYLFFTTALKDGVVRRDSTEARMTVKWMPLEAAVQAVRDGKITEAGTAIGLLLAARALAI